MTSISSNPVIYTNLEGPIQDKKKETENSVASTIKVHNSSSQPNTYQRNNDGSSGTTVPERIKGLIYNRIAANKEKESPTAAANKENESPTAAANKENESPTAAANKENESSTIAANKENESPTTAASTKNPLSLLTKKQLEDLPEKIGSPKKFVADKIEGGLDSLVEHYKAKNNQEIGDSFKAIFLNEGGAENNETAQACVEDFLIIRKMVLDNIPTDSPIKEKKIKELHEITDNFVASIIKHGKGASSLAAGCSSAGSDKLEKFNDNCNKLVGLSDVPVSSNEELASKIVDAINAVAPNLFTEDDKKENISFFRDSVDQHSNISNTISAKKSNDLLRNTGYLLRHEANILDLLDFGIKIVPETKADDTNKASESNPQKGEADDKDQGKGKGNIITNNNVSVILIDNSMHFHCRHAAELPKEAASPPINNSNSSNVTQNEFYFSGNNGKDEKQVENDNKRVKKEHHSAKAPPDDVDHNDSRDSFHITSDDKNDINPSHTTPIKQQTVGDDEKEEPAQKRTPWATVPVSPRYNGGPGSSQSPGLSVFRSSRSDDLLNNKNNVSGSQPSGFIWPKPEPSVDNSKLNKPSSNNNDDTEADKETDKEDLKQPIAESKKSTVLDKWQRFSYLKIKENDSGYVGGRGSSQALPDFTP